MQPRVILQQQMCTKTCPATYIETPARRRVAQRISMRSRRGSLVPVVSARKVLFLAQLALYKREKQVVCGSRDCGERKGLAVVALDWNPWKCFMKAFFSGLFNAEKFTVRKSTRLGPPSRRLEIQIPPGTVGFGRSFGAAPALVSSPTFSNLRNKPMSYSKTTYLQMWLGESPRSPTWVANIQRWQKAPVFDINEEKQVQAISKQVLSRVL
ncbi:hypothetical protein BDY19DRAFT_903968 [Irpex rosettiformis]|uniref:Uncharacterized protein n=1 Tax=Irpex rosettiformis TaxID=378272 RepID=A0ACB8UDH2_9APHY|nr:hypothetical protein BDY19DRAFT_903968 [Irpex rosettiformis]